MNPEDNLYFAKKVVKMNCKTMPTTLQDLLEILPRKTHNCEPFGFMLMTGEKKSKGNECKWTCCYYSHYSKKSDDRIPVIVGSSPKTAAFKMLKWFVKNMPESLLFKS